MAAQMCTEQKSHAFLIRSPMDGQTVVLPSPTVMQGTSPSSSLQRPLWQHQMEQDCEDSQTSSGSLSVFSEWPAQVFTLELTQEGVIKGRNTAEGVLTGEHVGRGRAEQNVVLAEAWETGILGETALHHFLAGRLWAAPWASGAGDSEWCFPDDISNSWMCVHTSNGWYPNLACVLT